MLVCDVGRALSLASIPIAFALGHLTIWQLYITAFLEGALMIVFMLAKTAAVSQVVTRTQLTAAIAQEEFVEGTTALFGPSLSGVLYTLGTMLPFITDAISYLISIVTMVLIRTPFQRERASTRRNVWAEIAEGVFWVWHQPFILTMTLLMGAGAFVFSGNVLIIIILAQQQHASAVVIGLIFRRWWYRFDSGFVAGSPPGTSLDGRAIHPADALVFCAELALVCACALSPCTRGD